MRQPSYLFAFMLLWAALSGARAEDALSPGLGPKHAIAMHGDPLHGPDFQHFRYVNPDAPKGGRLVLAEVATFDSLNAHIAIGRPMWFLVHPRRLFDTLMIRSDNEPFTMYGLLAETVEVPEDRSWVAFTLREEARFSDGSPLTVEDVLYTLKLQQEHGRRRNFYKKVIRAEQTGPRTVRFVFDPEAKDRELPLIMANMQIFSKRYYETHDFSKTTLEPPLGSGPYVITKVDPGRSVTFTRNPDYWGKDLAVNRGLNNFDEIRYEYYRDANAAFEAFKAGAVDVRREPDSNVLRWARGYDFPAARNGDVQRKEFTPPQYAGLLGLAINTRRAQFSDKRVREALVHAFDFAWMNENYFFNAYERTDTFFPVSELAAHGPASAAERTLLAPYMDEVDPGILEHGLRFVQGEDYYGRVREKLTRAMELFRAAGYDIRNNQMVNLETGAPFTFEIMIEHPDHQRVALNYADDLKKIGISVSVRLVDSSQFQTRSRNFEFDMMPFLWRRSFSPGAEQYFRWGSQNADTSSFNFSGVKSPAVDFLIEQLVASRSRKDLTAAARALDRVLLSGYYVVPFYHSKGDRVAWWSHLRHPDYVSITGYEIDSWWADPQGGPQ